MSDLGKHIDRVFQEGLNDFQPEAPQQAWRNIESQLQPKTKSRLIPFWFYKYAGVAAIAVLMFGLGFYYNYTQNTSVANNSQGFSEIDYDVNFTTEISTISPEAFSIIYQDLSLLSRPSIEADVTNQNLDKTQFEEQMQVSSVNSLLKQKSISSSNNVINSEAIPIFNFKMASTKAKEVKTLKNRWSLNPQVAPVFSNAMTNTSSLGSNFSSEGNAVNMAYGVNLAYKLTEKLKLRTGVNQVNLSYVTNDVTMTFDNPAFSDANINLNANNQYYAVVSSTEMANYGGENFRTAQNFGNINQQLGFIEIPLELEYQLINKKIGVNVIGGASTLILNNNALVFETTTTQTEIGQANNLNETSFSTNLGLGINYGLSKQWSFNFEPTFKYQINTFKSGTTNIQPYYFGVFTGVQFKF